MIKQPETTEEIIARGRKAVAEAQQVLAKSRRLIEQLGVTPEQCLEELRRQGGDKAVEAVKAEVQRVLGEVESDVQRAQQQQRYSTPGMRRVARRTNRI